MDHTPHPARRHATWLKTLHRWHWISAALSLTGLLLFSITGITLNHAGDITAKPRIERAARALPPTLVMQLSRPDETRGAGLPQDILQWVAQQWNVDLSGEKADWSAEEIYVTQSRPGGETAIRIDRQDGTVEYESTQRGWISYLNDLHKGRHTGAVWAWFIDILAAACVISSATGLLILQYHAGQRPSTWPVTGLGLILPLLLAILFIH